MPSGYSVFSSISCFWGSGVRQKVCRVGTRWMRNLILHPTSSLDRNLSKNKGRYVKNTNQKSSFFHSSSKINNYYFIILTIILLFKLLFYYFPQEAHFRPQISSNEEDSWLQKLKERKPKRRAKGGKKEEQKRQKTRAKSKEGNQRSKKVRSEYKNQGSRYTKEGNKEETGNQ